MIEKLRPGASQAGLVPQPHEDYGRLSIDLATARNNEEINIQGDYIAKIKYDGTDTGCYFKIDHRHAAKIYAKEFKSLQRRYARLFLTNTAQAGKVFVIQINETKVSVVEPELKTLESDSLDSIKNAVELIDDSIKAEDAAAGSGDKGVMALAVREDTDTVMAGTTGDYIPLSVDAEGHLRTHDKDALAQMVIDNTVLDTIDADTGAIKTAVEKMDDIVQIENSAHVSTQKGVMPLAVRKNVATAMGEDGDYHPIEVSSTGEVWVNDTNGNVLLGTIDVDSDAIKTAVEVMDDWDDGADHCETKEYFGGTMYENQVATTVSDNVFEESSFKLRSCYIKNNHATVTSAIGDAAAQRYQLAPGASVKIENVDLSTISHIRIGGADGTLIVIGSGL